MIRRILAAAAAATLVACVTPQQKDYSALSAAQVRSILVVPVMNRSVDVTAPDYFLSTVPIPLAERGYYVFPVNLVKRTLEDDGLADPGVVHAADPARLASILRRRRGPVRHHRAMGRALGPRPDDSHGGVLIRPARRQDRCSALAGTPDHAVLER